jgi:phage-related protein
VTLEFGCKTYTVFGIITMRKHRPVEERPLYWVGSSKADLLKFPEEVVDDIGYALGVVQYGGHPPSAKPWKGLGPGVSEIVEDDRSGTYRAVYTVRFRKAVYVLHAFQKKSPSGVRTARTDVKLIEDRLAAARDDYQERYGEEKI